MIIDPQSLNSRDAYGLLVSCIVPRPIAFITSVNTKGRVNAAPYSFFNALSASPPLLVVSAARSKGAKKGTTENILSRKEFVVNLISESLLEKMILSTGDFPPEVSKVEEIGLSLLPSQSVAVPRIAESPVSCECTLYKHFTLADETLDLLIGEIRRYHIADSLFTEGVVDQKRLKPVSRMGGRYYAVIERILEFSAPARRKNEGSSEGKSETRR